MNPSLQVGDLLKSTLQHDPNCPARALLQMAASGTPLHNGVVVVVEVSVVVVLVLLVVVAVVVVVVVAVTVVVVMVVRVIVVAVLSHQVSVPGITY